MREKVLIIDDHQSVASSLRDMLLQEGFEPETALDAATGLAKALEGDFDVVVTDLQMPGPQDPTRTQGLDLVRTLRQERPHLPVILMTGYHTTETAIQATQLGAFDYILKPINPAEFLNLLRKAAENKQAATDPVGFGNAPAAKSAIVGNSRLMQEVYKEIGRVAATPVTVLIRGETGTGKELVARALYQHGGRENQPFIIVNCAALPDTLLESELFGHEAGAFTDARLRRIGRFEQAHTGTIFLDEIGDLGPHTQVKLLRVLQERSIQRLGGKETVEVDVRILAATHRDLEAAVSEGKFRSDLYFRIQEAVIKLPPLRERLEDIPDLTRYFLDRCSAELNVPRASIEPAALEFFEGQLWPGNVRQLRATVRKALLSSQRRPITSALVEEALHFTRGHPEPGLEKGREPADDTEVDQPFTRRVNELLAQAQEGKAEKVQRVLWEEAERELYGQAMRLAANNQTQVARWLGVSRPTVREKLTLLGISTEPGSRVARLDADVRVLLVAAAGPAQQALCRRLEARGYVVSTAHDLSTVVPRANCRDFDLVLSNVALGSDSGLEVVSALRKSAPRLPVILMASSHSTDDAIEASKRGAYDYFVNLEPDAPADGDRTAPWLNALTEVLERAVRSKQATEAVVLPEDTPIWEEKREHMLGRSRAMREVYKEIGRLAGKPVTVLIRGETGTGKELVARALYQHGDRPEQPFIVVNCAALPETLLESELFGHEAGAFTDAKARRIGRFEQADHGTIFLDEIGDMSLSTQAKLLRVLQERTIQRLGGTDTLTLDVRILAATHRDLEGAIAAGAFRSDLYFRFGEAVVYLPPLRERREDIDELGAYFAQRDGAELGWPTSALTAEALAYLRAQPWPGNVRELRNVVRRAILLARGYAITPEELEKAVNPVKPPDSTASLLLQRFVRALLAKAQRGEIGGIESVVFETLERELYRQAIAASEGDQTRAARWLGVSRPTMRDKLARYGLVREKDAPAT